jgi:hypothetical protein
LEGEDGITGRAAEFCVFTYLKTLGQLQIASLLQGIVVFDSNKKYHWYDAQRVPPRTTLFFAHLFVVLTTTSMSFWFGSFANWRAPCAVC